MQACKRVALPRSPTRFLADLPSPTPSHTHTNARTRIQQETIHHFERADAEYLRAQQRSSAPSTLPAIPDAPPQKQVGVPGSLPVHWHAVPCTPATFRPPPLQGPHSDSLGSSSNSESIPKLPLKQNDAPAAAAAGAAAAVACSVQGAPPSRKVPPVRPTKAAQAAAAPPHRPAEAGKGREVGGQARAGSQGAQHYAAAPPAPARASKDGRVQQNRSTSRGSKERKREGRVAAGGSMSGREPAAQHPELLDAQPVPPTHPPPPTHTTTLPNAQQDQQQQLEQLEREMHRRLQLRDQEQHRGGALAEAQRRLQQHEQQQQQLQQQYHHEQQQQRQQRCVEAPMHAVPAARGGAAEPGLWVLRRTGTVLEKYAMSKVRALVHVLEKYAMSKVRALVSRVHVKGPCVTCMCLRSLRCPR